MADEKKTLEHQSDRKTVEQIIGLLAMLLLIGAIASAILAFLDNLNTGNSFWIRFVDYFLKYIWPIWKIIAAIVSVLSIAGIVHNMRQLAAINAEEQKIYGLVPESLIDESVVAEPKNERWEKIIAYMNSPNESEWRLAVIEADVMLEETMRALGFVGESIGEMLKSANENDFITLQDAWEGHKVRNQIAHEGDKFQLNERTTKTTIAHFEKVFKEFGII